MTTPEERQVELELRSIVGSFRSFASSMRRGDAAGAESARFRLERRVEAFCRGKPHHQRTVRQARQLVELARQNELGKAARAVERLVA